MRRTLLWLIALVLAALVVGGVWLWRSDPKAEVEALLGQALGRDVRIGSLAIDPRGHVTLRDVDIGNPAGWDGAPLLHAAQLDLDVALSTLLDREVAGVVTASGVELRVIRHGGVVNLEGLIRPPGATGSEPIDLHLDVAIVSSRVLIEDHDRGNSLALEGVDVRVLVTNRDEGRTANATVRIAEVGLHGLPIRGVTMTVRSDERDVVIDDLHGTIGDRGEVTGSGRLLLAGERDWQFEIAATGVDLDADVRRVVAAVYPPLLSTVEATAATGRIGAEVSLAGTGLHWAQIRPSLTGKGTVHLLDVVLPRGSLMLGIAALVGGGDQPWTMSAADVVFTVADGWIDLVSVTTAGAPTSLPIRGRVSLVGELDLTVDLMPLVPLFGGGIYREAARYATSLPVRVTGTLEQPKLAPPSLSDVGKSLLGGAIRRSLGGAP